MKKRDRYAFPPGARIGVAENHLLGGKGFAATTAMGRILAARHRARLTFSDRLQVFCVAYIVIWAISPPLAYGTSYRAIAVLLAALWILIELLKRPAGLIRPTAPIIAAVVYMAYSAAWAYYFDGYEGLEQNFQIYIFLLFLIFYERYSRRNFEILRPIFWISLVLLPIWIVRTLIAYESTHNVSRLLVRSSDIAREYTRLGVGGYALVYTMTVAVPILLYLLKHRVSLASSRRSRYRRRISMGLLALNLVLALAMILRAGYTIALIITAVSMVIVLFVPNRRAHAPPRLIVVVLLGSLLFVVVGSLFLGFIASQSQGTMYQQKVIDLERTIESDELVGTVAGRVERYWRSILLTLGNPFFGTLTRTDVGKHSAILDRFAQFGVVFGVVFAYAVLYLPLRYLRRSNQHFALVLAVVFVVTTFTLSNNIFSALGYMVFIFFPVAYSYLDDPGRA